MEVIVGGHPLAARQAGTPESCGWTYAVVSDRESLGRRRRATASGKSFTSPITLGRRDSHALDTLPTSTQGPTLARGEFPGDPYPSSTRANYPHMYMHMNIVARMRHVLETERGRGARFARRLEAIRRATPVALRWSQRAKVSQGRVRTGRTEIGGRRSVSRRRYRRTYFGRSGSGRGGHRRSRGRSR